MFDSRSTEWLLKYKLCSTHSCLQCLAESCLHYSGVQILKKQKKPEINRSS